MDDKQRTQRLVHTLNGTGATVNGPYQVWAVGGTVIDAHLFALAEWADLIHLALSGCPITNESLPAISRFHRLESLDIGGTNDHVCRCRPGRASEITHGVGTVRNLS